jgi:hypothetical protein
MEPDNGDLFKHDLKNQLGIVLGFIELLIEDTPESDRRRQDMLEVRRAARACLELLQGARSDQGPVIRDP